MKVGWVDTGACGCAWVEFMYRHPDVKIAAFIKMLQKPNLMIFGNQFTK
jgi:hypothetical protein